MRLLADRSVTPFARLALLLILLSLVMLAACGNDTKTPPPPPPPPAVTISVSPATTSVEVGATKTFTASVANTTNTAVTWSIDEGTSGGSITSAGVYTPPNAEGTFHITATSQADATKKATAAITVTISTTVAVTPTTAAIAINGQQAFTAAVTDVTDESVTWSVQEGEAGGVIDDAGNYTAPNKAGTYHVVVASVEHPTKSAAAAVTVTAPAPTFSSTAPTTAAEAEPYTYTIDAVDPAGGTLEFVLTDGPSNVTIEGNVLTWTPAKEQSRVANSFAIQAVSSEGGSATQEWSVTPTGIIRGQMIAKHLSSSGVTDVPVDLTSYDIYAYVPAEDGTLTELPGTGTPEGTFEIPGVAAGKYWLSIYGGMMLDATPEPGCDNGQILTNRSDIDLSCYVQGRSDVAHASEGTLRHFQVQGISPWQDGDYLELAIPDTNEWNGWSGLVPDSISYDGTQPAYHLATGDAGTLGQWTSAFSSGGRPYGLLTKVLNTEITDVDGGTATVAGTMQNVAGTNAFDASIAGTKFKALNSQINPNTTTEGSELYIETHPFGLSHGYVTYGPALFAFSAWDPANSSNPPVDTDIYLGQFTYGNPFPSTWPLIAEYWHDTYTQYSINGASSGLETSYYQFTDALPTLENPIAPILGPVTNATIGEGAFFDDQEISTTPTITWEAPATGTAQGYMVHILQAADGYMYTEFEFQTTDTTVTIPADILQPGNTYVFAIEALNETGQDLAATPFMKGFPRAGAWTTSGVLTVAAPVEPTVRAAAAAKKLTGLKPMHKLTKTLGSSRRQFHKPVQVTK